MHKFELDENKTKSVISKTKFSWKVEILSCYFLERSHGCVTEKINTYMGAEDAKDLSRIFQTAFSTKVVLKHQNIW